jgi:hypothetical protein
MKFLIALLAAASMFDALAERIETIPFRPAANMTRAEIRHLDLVSRPVAVLVLCPGMNGQGTRELQDPKWQEFARTQNLGLMAISFASDPGLLDHGKGYPFAADGSGQILLDAIRKVYGKDLPILLYGFSSGAFFTELFADWKPDRVLAWSAHGTGWCGPQKFNKVPGLISCGDMDESRYGGAIMYFKQGRALGKPLLWLSLPKVSHGTTAQQEQFVRRFFVSVLSGSSAHGDWVDVDRKTSLVEQEAFKTPAVSGWLPDRELFEPWAQLHSP